MGRHPGPQHVLGPDLLATNDAVFYRPTASHVANFTRQHHMRWLVSVARIQLPTEMQRNRLVDANPGLAAFATERFSTGDITSTRSPVDGHEVGRIGSVPARDG